MNKIYIYSLHRKQVLRKRIPLKNRGKVPLIFDRIYKICWCLMANSSKEIRVIGLTTPDKPVAKRSSTVPVQGRVAKKRTNEHGACLASHRSTLLRMLLFVLLTPISRCPFLSYPPLCLYSASLARPRAPVPSPGSKSPESPNNKKKKRRLTDMHRRF